MKMKLSLNNSLKDMLDSYEKDIVERNLIKYEWNISKTARNLNIDRSRLYRIIAKHKLDRYSQQKNQKEFK